MSSLLSDPSAQRVRSARRISLKFTAFLRYVRVSMWMVWQKKNDVEKPDMLSPRKNSLPGAHEAARRADVALPNAIIEQLDIIGAAQHAAQEAQVGGHTLVPSTLRARHPIPCCPRALPGRVRRAPVRSR